MKAYKLSPEFRKKNTVYPEGISLDQFSESIIDQAALEETEMVLPDVNPFRQILNLQKVESDAEAAFSLYRSFPPHILRGLQYDVGFWQWLTLSTPWGKAYVTDRWDKHFARTFHDGIKRQALSRLWIAAHLLGREQSGPNEDEILREQLGILFSKQDYYEGLLGRKAFADQQTLTAFLKFLKTEKPNKDDFRLIIRRLRYVIVLRFIPGLGPGPMQQEINKIADVVLRKGMEKT